MFLLEHTSDITRNTALGTNGRKQMPNTPLYVGLPCLILPMRQQAAIQNGFSVGRAYNAYYDSGTDVKVGDRITWSGKTLHVSAVQDYAVSFAGHVHVMCTESV